MTSVPMMVRSPGCPPMADSPRAAATSTASWIGAMVGLSCHNPLEVEYAEEKGWDLDYYMTSLYYMIRPRAEFEKLLGGHSPLGEIYLPSDPPRMMETIRKARKPCSRTRSWLPVER